MDFRQYAANETTRSINSLFAASAEASRHQLEGLRAALEATTQALDSALNPSSRVDHDVAALVDHLAAAATVAAEQAAKHVSDAARRVQDDLSAQLEAQTRDKDALSLQVKDAQAQADALRTELHQTIQRADAMSDELTQARSALDKLDATRVSLTAARDEEARGRATAETALRTTRELVDALRQELATVGDRLEQAIAERAVAEDATSTAQSQAQAADAKLAAVTDLFKASAARVKILERTQADHERIIRELQARTHAPAQPPAGPRTMSDPVALLEELLGGFQALDTAKTIPEVLTTLLEQLAAQFARVALFRVRSNHLQGEHQIGFDAKTDIGKVVIPLGMDSLLTRAAASGHIERLSDAEVADTSGALFSGTPTCALALPIVVADDKLAVIYADDSGSGSDEVGGDAIETSVHFADAMLQHAVALLMRHTNELKTLAELRAYASSLVQEIEQMYVSDVGTGKSGHELQSRLKGNVDYARSIYANRVALEGADASALLDDQLAALLEAQHSTPFGADLAAIIGRPETRRSAEAS
jgi:hypothetical protein